MFVVISNSQKNKILTASDEPLKMSDVPEAAKKHLHKVGFAKISMVNMPDEYSTQINNKYIEYYISQNDTKLLSAMGKKYKFVNIDKVKTITGGGGEDFVKFIRDFKKPTSDHILIVIVVLILLLIIYFVVRYEHFKLPIKYLR